jgi:hypothetical protein
MTERLLLSLTVTVVPTNQLSTVFETFHLQLLKIGLTSTTAKAQNKTRGDEIFSEERSEFLSL